MSKNPTIPLIALDLDGTLLHNDKQISEYTQSVLKKLSDLGHILVPTTGRNLSAIPEPVLRISGVRHAICSNGANLYEVPSRKLLHDTVIPAESVLELLEYLGQFPLFLYLHTSEGTIRSTGWRESGLAARFPFLNFEENNVPDLADYVMTHPVKVWKIGVFTLDAGTFTLLLENGSPCPAVSMLRTGDCNIELNSIYASKGNGLAALCDILHIPVTDVLAIGDNQNDISMLQLAGISVAMGNAEADVKAVADYIAKTNEEDGAAQFLAHYFNLSL